MSQSDESDKPFTVSDRRHFTPEGRPRENVEAQASPEAAPGDERKRTTGAETQGETPRAEAPSEEGPSRGLAGPADFAQFVVGLAAQAGALLAGNELPEGLDAREAFEGARSMIAILEMLKQKTAGNLSEPEAALLDDLLFQLRMAYVEKSRTGGA